MADPVLREQVRLEALNERPGAGTCLHGDDSVEHDLALHHLEVVEAGQLGGDREEDEVGEDDAVEGREESDRHPDTEL